MGGDASGLNSAASSSGLSGGAIAAIVIFLLVVPLLIFGAVVTYAYLHPTSPTGLYLIEVSTTLYPPCLFILTYANLHPTSLVGLYLIEVSTIFDRQCAFILKYTPTSTLPQPPSTSRTVIDRGIFSHTPTPTHLPSGGKYHI